MNDLIQDLVNFRNYNHSDVDSLIVFQEDNDILSTISSNGAGVESMQAKWEEMFGVKEEVVEQVEVKKPRKKPASRKKAESAVTEGKAPAKKPRKKAAAKKKVESEEENPNPEI